MSRSLHLRRSLLMLAAVLLVIAVAAGCRSRSKDAPAEEAPTAEVASEDVSAPAAEVQAESPAEEQAETEQPAEEASAETSEEAEQPAEGAAAESSAQDDSVVQGVCNHPYYPIRDGAVYRYQMTAAGMEPTEMAIAFSVTGPDSFVTTQTFSGMTTETEWQCTPDGLLRTDFGLGGLDIPGLEYTVDGSNGVTFPPADQLQEGVTWQNDFSMSGEMSMEGFAMKMNIQAVTDNVLSGFEEVTTPAGTFTAAKVDSKTTVDLSTDMGAAPAMPAMDSTSTMWLSEGVGMVKTVSADPMGGSSTMELVALE